MWSPVSVVWPHFSKWGILDLYFPALYKCTITILILYPSDASMPPLPSKIGAKAIRPCQQELPIALFFFDLTGPVLNAGTLSIAYHNLTL